MPEERSVQAGNQRPLVFVDLDDTLFQTARKMGKGGPRHVAAMDAGGQPNSYMSRVQRSFADWLLACADVVPVTARSVEAYGRVRLPFAHGAICAYGGVLLDTRGRPDLPWREQMEQKLGSFQERLPVLCESVLAIGADAGFSLRGWVVAEGGLRLYMVVKRNAPDVAGRNGPDIAGQSAADAVVPKAADDAAALAEVLAAVRARGLLAGMRVHLNGNNLAFLPDGLDKGPAVREWLRRDRELQGERPVLGFGDSLTDLGFMGACHLWGTPSGGQLAQAVEAAVHG